MSSQLRHPQYFDYATVATRAGIPESDLVAVEERVRQDYPNDPMMFELRMFRICRAIERGVATVTDALKGDNQSFAA